MRLFVGQYAKIVQQDGQDCSPLLASTCIVEETSTMLLIGLKSDHVTNSSACAADVDDAYVLHLCDTGTVLAPRVLV